jgi:hypothetical protein
MAGMVSLTLILIHTFNQALQGKGDEMARKTIETTGDRLKELETQRGVAQEALESHQEREGMVRAELEAKEANLRELDVELSERVEALLKNIPPGDSARLIGELEQFRQSGRFELTEGITVLQTALKAEAREVWKAEGQLKEIGRLIQQEVDDRTAREVHACALEFVERFKVCNGARMRLFDMTLQAPFSDWPERFQRLGLKWPTSLGVLLQSHISKRNPDGLDVAEIARRLESISQAYGEKPLQLPGSKGMQNPPPMERNWYHNPPPEREN